MCGIAGFLDPSRASSPDDLSALAQRMAGTLRHRGPDDAGTWCDPDAGIALGHRRLSIIDLSAEGHQPMLSASGRYVITYNGEIYNFPALRKELEGAGQKFRGGSDTEVALASIERWGLGRSVSRFNGMFAFALWDRETRTLHLVRDRLGEKPLYYGRFGRTFVFGSELKALRAHPAFRGEIDRGALALYLRHNCVPAPWSIYEGVRKLPPASIVTVSCDGSISEPVLYWSAREAVGAGMADPVTDAHDAAAELEALLRDAVALRMVADVPLGAFLSGGVDSSTVVALMQAQSAQPVRTFTIGTHDARFNEAAEARAVATHLGTDHTELYVTPRDAEAVIPRIPSLYDEPFSDSSQIPTFLVSELARRNVTVSLSGEGGDELFAGYNRHLWVRKVHRGTGWMPGALRRAAGRGLRVLQPDTWDSVYRAVAPMVPGKLRARMVGDKLLKLSEVLGGDGPEEMYRSLTSHWKNPAAVVLGSWEPPTAASANGRSRESGYVEWMMYLDMVTYLPDDPLTKLDRATMALSLEARVPLLDHRVVEFAGRIPLQMKIRDGQGKWLLRRVLYRYVPPALIERPKIGFGVPIGEWLRGSLREWASSLLDPARLRAEGYFDPAPIRRKWTEHLAGRGNWQYDLWDVLVFQAWLECQDAKALVAGRA